MEQLSNSLIEILDLLLTRRSFVGVRHRQEGSVEGRVVPYNGARIRAVNRSCADQIGRWTPKSGGARAYQ